MKIERVSSVFVMCFFWLCVCNHMFVVYGLCLDNQQSLLLQLKNSLRFSKSESARKLKSWNTSDDCCGWMGVTCDKEGHVSGLDLSQESISGGINNSTSLFRLKHLQNLNLAENIFDYEFPSGFNKLENLHYLNLSNHMRVEPRIPMEISQLTRLVTLDLSSSYDLIPNLRKFVQNLTSVRQLYLDGVRITATGKEWSHALLPLRDLQVLSLKYCVLSGPLDSSLTKLENLSVVTLDYNNLISSPVPETFANFKNLTMLSLVECGLTGTFPQKIFQIATLSVIDLSFNEDLQGVFPDSLSGSLQTLRVRHTSFSGAFPDSTGSMRQLFELALSDCRFNGTLPNSVSNLTSLHYLDLSSNKFTGSVPSSLFMLPFLETILLSNNQFSQLDEFINVTSSKLVILDLSNNNLSGPFPVFLYQLSALTFLQLPSNKFSGSVKLNKLLELTNFTSLDISYTNLTVNVDVTNFDPFLFSQSIQLHLASCNLKHFPNFLRNMSGLWYLDLSDNQIQGTVPNWIWKLPNLQYLNFSHNMLTDIEGPLLNITPFLARIDLHNNQLQGPIPVFPTIVVYLDYSRNKFSSLIPMDFGNYVSRTAFLSLSNNNFHGSIPDSLCNASNLLVLDLSANDISGAIPFCLMKMTTLEVLNLHKNNLTGNIPDMFLSSCVLKTLNLNGNLLDGPIPKSLAYCSTLEVLDLGTNQLIGGFPCFLNEISTLRVMILRNNRLQGSLGCSEAEETWQMLQIVDIAFNKFSGKLQGEYFTTWDTMMHDDSTAKSEFSHIQLIKAGFYYDYSVTVVSKGLQMELIKILTIFTCIDFSSNHFEGPIPEELMDFTALYVFNLSNNAFSGEIPSSIGNLKHLESLDLSMNNLQGEIPVQLASLSFLSYLNLSFNHLRGKIPTGTQLQSFQASSFEGNDGLYGPPLTEEPKGKKQGLQPQAQPSCRKLTCEIDWNFLSAELGLVFGLGTVFFPLLFWKSWRVQYWGFVDKVLCWIFPQLYLDRVTRRGQTYTVLRWWH